MKAKTADTVQLKIVRVTAIGVAAIGALAIWGRAPIARATDAAMTHSRLSAALRQVRTELNLTQKQQAELQTILSEAIPQGVAIHDNMSLSPAQKRTRLRQLRATTRQRAVQVLTPEQRRKARGLLAAARPRIHARLQQIAQELELTETQKAKIQPILAGAFKQGMAIKDDMRLTLAQKLIRAQQLRADTRLQLGHILTPGQMEKLDRIVDAAQTDLAAIVRARRHRHIG